MSKMIASVYYLQRMKTPHLNEFFRERTVRFMRPASDCLSASGESLMEASIVLEPDDYILLYNMIKFEIIDRYLIWSIPDGARDHSAEYARERKGEYKHE